MKLFGEGLTVAYDRELRYRLEAKFPHDAIGKAIIQLEQEGELLTTNVPGRPGAGDLPNKFYRLPDSDYQSLLPLMKKKLDLSAFIVRMAGEMGILAERAWWRAFKRNGWDVHPASEEDSLGINNYKNRRATTNHDIDFVAEKDGISYGVEVKNGLSYPNDLYWKFNVAVEIDTVPLIIARWLNPAQIPLLEELTGIPPIVYREGLYSTSYSAVVNDARNILAVPIIAKDDVDDTYFRGKIDAIHNTIASIITTTKARLTDYLLTKRNNTSIRSILGASGQSNTFPRE